MRYRPLELLLDFDDQVQRDRGQTPAFLHRRDRRFALDCEAQGEPADVAHWLAHLNRLSGPDDRGRASLQQLHSWRRIQFGFAVAGILLGAATMIGLLFFSQAQRINITVLLAFVVLQLLLAVATTLQALLGWQPWRWLLQRAAQPGEQLMAALQPLLMARAAHAGGVCFALAGLATLLLLLVVQDLAFGWSTTLNTATESYHRLLSTIALPWQWLWPAAVPSQELVEATRFFRVAPTDSDTAPERWGAWWPFVVMLWSTWVLLPRLVLWTLSHWLLGRKARCLLTRHPAMQALRYRMEAPALDTGSQHNDAGDLPDTHRQAKPQPLIPSSLVISWAGATGLRLPQLLLAPDVELFKAGGRATLVEDTQVLAAVADRLQAIKEPRVALVVCGWEPPTGELFDFLVQARAQWPQSTKLAIVPLGQDTEPLSNPLLQTWLRFAERLPVGFASVTPASPAKVNEEAVR